LTTKARLTTDERHHVADGAERHQVEQRQEIGRRRSLPLEPAAPPELAIDGDQRHEGDADGGEMALPGKIVLPVGIDQRQLAAARRRPGDGRG
jgi:hypothetical protein